MDSVLRFLSEYAASLTYDQLSKEAVHHTKRRMIDSLGCALGGYNDDPPRIARSYALEVTAKPGSTVFGTSHRSTPEMAAFANGVMVRYLDFNDTGLTVDFGHPSDNIPAALAMAEYASADARTVITAIVLAYEVQDRLSDVCGIYARGWDQATYVALSAAAAAGKCLGLDKDRMANALALAGASHEALGQIRVGTLSMLKGCAAGVALRNGVFAAIIAGKGLTGPAEIFEGSRGWFQQLSGRQIKLPVFGGKGHGYAIEQDKYKYFPTDYEAQCSVHPALELRKDIGGKVDDIEHIVIDTYDGAWEVAAKTPDRWNPTTRETADHSLPYVQAVAFTKGDIWLDDFTEERIRDPRIHAFIKKMEVRRNEEFTRAYPEAYWFRIEVTMKSGEKHMREIAYAKGHPKNPMSDKEIETKFRRLVAPLLKPRQMDSVLNRVWQLEQVSDISQVMALLKVP